MVNLMKRRGRRPLVKLTEVSTNTSSAESAQESFKYEERSLKMVMGSFYIPKHNQNKPLGEDAHFIFADEKREVIGVADGVGGWSRMGIDSGEYARELMANSIRAVKDYEVVDPMIVLYEAFLNTEAPGSSTACIFTLTPNNVLHAANVGDSGFVVIRGFQIVYKSPVQHHKFNCPFQLGNTKDTPSAAQQLKITVTDGDIVVAGTDGLFDNLHDSDIEEIVKRGIHEGRMPPELASDIANFALIASQDKNSISPFACTAWVNGFNVFGGKIDDITVVVSYIGTK